MMSRNQPHFPRRHAEMRCEELAHTHIRHIALGRLTDGDGKVIGRLPFDALPFSRPA